jgi:hypothetical protein
MDFSLTPEQELIRDSAREFYEREIVPQLIIGRGSPARALSRRRR